MSLAADQNTLKALKITDNAGALPLEECSHGSSCNGEVWKNLYLRLKIVVNNYFNAPQWEVKTTEDAISFAIYIDCSITNVLSDYFLQHSTTHALSQQRHS